MKVYAVDVRNGGIDGPAPRDNDDYGLILLDLMLPGSTAGACSARACCRQSPTQFVPECTRQVDDRVGAGSSAPTTTSSKPFRFLRVAWPERAETCAAARCSVNQACASPIRGRPSAHRVTRAGEAHRLDRSRIDGAARYFMRHAGELCLAHLERRERVGLNSTATPRPSDVAVRAARPSSTNPYGLS